MTKLKLLALGILAATAASTVQAESQWTVGAGAGVINSPYKQYDRDVYPVPVVTYEGDNFWFRGLGGGYYLWNDTADKLSIMAYYDPTYFKPGRQRRQCASSAGQAQKLTDGRAFLRP